MSEYGTLVHAVSDIGNCATMTLNSSGGHHTSDVSCVNNHVDVMCKTGDCTTTVTVPVKHSKPEGKPENVRSVVIEREPTDNKKPSVTLNGQIRITSNIVAHSDFVQDSEEKHVNDIVAASKDSSVFKPRSEPSSELGTDSDVIYVLKSDESCKLNKPSSEISVQPDDLSVNGLGESENKSISGGDSLCASPTDGQSPCDVETPSVVECVEGIPPKTDDSIDDFVPTEIIGSCVGKTSEMNEGSPCQDEVSLNETAETSLSVSVNVSRQNTQETPSVSCTSPSSKVSPSAKQPKESEGGDRAKDKIELETAGVHKEKVDDKSPSICIKSKDGSQISLLKFNPGRSSSGLELKPSESQSTNDGSKGPDLTDKEVGDEEPTSTLNKNVQDLNSNALPNSNDEHDMDLNDAQGASNGSVVAGGVVMDMEEKSVGLDTVDGGGGGVPNEDDDLNSVENECENDDVSITNVEDSEEQQVLKNVDDVDGLEEGEGIRMDGLEVNVACDDVLAVSSEDVDMTCDDDGDAIREGAVLGVLESSCHDTGVSSECGDGEGGTSMMVAPDGAVKDIKEGTSKPEDDTVKKEEKVNDSLCATKEKDKGNSENVKDEEEENVHLKIDKKDVAVAETKVKTVKLEQLKTEDINSISETPVKSFNDKDLTLKEDELSVENSKPETEQVNFKDILKVKADGPKVKLATLTADSGSEDDAIVIEENDVEVNSRKPSDLSSSLAPEGDTNNSNDDSRQVKSPQSPGDETNLQQGRKRSISSLEETSTDSAIKKSRLDSVVNKLEGHLGSNNSPDDETVVLMDSDDDDAAKNRPKDATSLPVSQKDKPEEKPGVTLTSAALRNLIVATLKTVVRTHKLEKTRQLEDRMSKMESANTLWMGSAKHLEKSVDELTKFSKEIDKRKNQSQKLKHLSSRNVAVQVTIPIPNHYAQMPRPVLQPAKAADQPPKQILTPRSQQQRSHSATLKLPPSLLLNHNQQRLGTTPNNMQGSVVHHSPAVRQTMAATPQRPAGLPPQGFSPQGADQNRFRFQRTPQNFPSQKPSPTYQQIRPPGANPPPPQARPNVVRQPMDNLIDLTDEDDTSKKTPGPPQSKANPSNTRTQVPHRNSPQSSPQGARMVPSLSNSTPQHTPPAVNRLEGSKKPASNNSNHTIRQGPPVQYVQKSGTPGNVGRAGGGAPRHLMTPGGASVKAQSLVLPSLPPSVHNKHPAPFPSETNTVVVPVSAKFIPPKPSLKISRVVKGIVLSWNMPQSNNVEVIVSYQLFAYQESSTIPNPSSWKKVGDVKALPLPMACTLTQFQEGNKYYFAVRAVDQFGRWGEYSDPSSIYLYPEGANTGGTRES